LQSDRNDHFVETKGLSGIDILLVEDDAGTRQATSIYYDNMELTCAKPIRHRRPEKFWDSPPGSSRRRRWFSGEDGYMLIREVRQWEQERKLTPVCAVAVTAFASAEDRKKALAADLTITFRSP